MRSFILSAIAGIALLSTTTVFASPTSEPSTYPLSTCIISGETLGDHGEVITREVDGREIRLCCKSCVKDLEKDQTAYLEALDEAIIAAQLPAYPLQTCVVSGEASGREMGDPVNHLLGNRLVRLCCNMCKKDVAADPAKYIAKLDDAVVAAQAADYPAAACPISGQALGSMGEPFDFVYAGTLVRFCCGGCIGKFNEDPTKALATVYGAAQETPSGDHDHHDHSGHKH
jgi:hypothetical protein